MGDLPTPGNFDNLVTLDAVSRPESYQVTEVIGPDRVRR